MRNTIVGLNLWRKIYSGWCQCHMPSKRSIQFSVLSPINVCLVGVNDGRKVNKMKIIKVTFSGHSFGLYEPSSTSDLIRSSVHRKKSVDLMESFLSLVLFSHLEV
jgi:hypothetical protein